ncbi:MAG: glycerophosphoryl diester phosphodiesterase [Rhodospirillales bacterium]|nr:glycerophosphoryl diester phosphodiesterase [Rhodospirillales bacterium]
MINPNKSLMLGVIGHRGAAGHAPENTLASLAKAAELGVRWVEFDVMLTADKAVVLFHDDKLDRITLTPGTLDETPLAVLRTLDAGAWFDAAFAGEKVPTLEEAVETLARLDLGANVEIKPSPGRETETGKAVGEALLSLWPGKLPSPVISSFEAAALAAARDAAPALDRALNVFKIPRNWKKQLQQLDCSALHCREGELTAAKARAVLDAGYCLRAFTVNDRARAKTLFGWGVEAVFSDFPDRLMYDPVP